MPQTKAGTIPFESSNNDLYSFDVRDTPQNRPVKENYAERQLGQPDFTVSRTRVKRG